MLLDEFQLGRGNASLTNLCYGLIRLIFSSEEGAQTLLSPVAKDYFKNEAEKMDLEKVKDLMFRK